jgi:hypothetical protein
MSNTIEQEIPLELLETVMPEAWLQPKDMPTPQELDIMEKRIGHKFMKVGGFKASADPKSIERTKMIQFEPTNLFPCHDVDNAKVRMRYHVRICCGERIRIDQRTQKPNSFPEVIADFMCDVDKFVKDYKPI